MQETRGGDALASARALLDRAGIAHVPEVAIGPIIRTIAARAAEGGFDAIVMGSHGAGKLGSVLMGSVTSGVIHLTDRPVTVVK